MLINEATEIPGGAVKLSSFPRSEVSHRTVFIYSGAKRAPRGVRIVSGHIFVLAHRI